MKCFIASDHAGFLAKTKSILFLKNKGFEVVDLGTDDEERVDYPDFAQKLCKELIKEKQKAFGVLICGTGIGMSVAANRFKQIRAALCHDKQSAILAREHNDANVLCFGARNNETQVQEEILEAFFSSNFQEGRHQQRVEKIELFE